MSVGRLLRASIELGLEPKQAFDAVVEELSGALARLDLCFEQGPEGRIFRGAGPECHVVSWSPPDHIRMEWRPADWAPDEVTEVELSFEPIEGGTRVSLEHRHWGRLIGDGAELAGWFATEVAAPLLYTTSSTALGDWLTDRQARRPSGAAARTIYGDPLYHYPNFRAILAELALRPDDFLLEVGCGGGAFLRDALESGCRAAAVDHSPDMVRLALDQNAAAVAQGRLDVLESAADELPFPDGIFTAAVMTGVLGFLPDPVGALAEMHRTLAPGGRVVVLGSDPELRGTPAAPEPFASRLRFYDEEELAALAREAGFAHVEVALRDLEAHARAAGVPEEHVPLFQGPTRFLLARKAPT